MIKSLKYIYTSKLLLVAFFLTSIFVVAQPTTGNITDKFTSPGSSYTFSHTQNSGSDRLLVVIVHNPNGTNTSGVTYGGVSLTSKLNYNTSAIGWRTRIWYLEDPAEGSNNVVVTFSGNQTNKSGMIAVSFTNSDGIGVTGTNTSGGYAAWETVTLTVEDNSKILFGGLSSSGTVNSLQSPTSTNITKEWNSGVCCSKGAFGGVSAALSAGSTSSRSKENGGHNYPYALEILSAVSCTNGTVDAGSALSGICSGGTSGAMGGSYGGGATASTWSGGAGTWTNATDANTATYTAGASESGDITLTLTATGGCADVTDTKTITVTAAPSAGTLSGTQGICVSGSTTFSSTEAGGTWSSGNTGIATINSSSGAISGVSAGTATITYTQAGSGGCSDATATRTVTVTAAPASAGTLSGTQGICVSGSTTFSSTVSGGTWSSNASYFGTINSSSGVINGVAAGTPTMTYTIAGSGGCANATATRTITVTAAPSAGTLSGTQGICVSGSTTFSSTVSGGTWSSGNTGIATINSSSGAISGVSAGTATITYTQAGSGGCSDATATRTVTVTAATASAGTLSGTQGICVSGSTTFSSTVNGGTWSSNATGVATVNSSSGAISGVSAGTATITYTQAGSGGCSDNTETRTVTVTAAPASAGTLSGTQGICVSGSTTFSSTVSGGTWSSGNTGIATINSSSGAISGVSAGTATITYTQTGSGGCSDATATKTVHVYATAPGGVASNLLLWLKADAQANNSGTTLATDGQRVDNWKDQTYNDLDADDSGGSGPVWVADGINGNPVLDFTGSESGGNPLDIPLGIMQEETKTNMYVYAVCVTDVNQANTLFFQDLNSSNTTDMFSFIPRFSGANHTYWDNGHNSAGRLSIASGASLDQPYLYSLKSTSGAMGIKRNNYLIATNTKTGSSTADNILPFYIGYRYNNSGAYFDGKLAELIILDGVPSSAEEDQIESYLSMKYGIGLETAADLKSSSGTEIWDKDENSSYNTGVTGIGRDDVSGLDQKSSQSENSSDILKISTISNAQTGADNSFEMWGNNNGAVSVSTGNETHDNVVFSQKIARKWLIQETGTVGAVTVEIDLTNSTFAATDPQKIALVFDNDGGFDGSSDESFTAANTYNSATKKLTFNSVDLADDKYVTLMKSVSVLPVEMRTFNVKAEGCFAHITWSTASEINNDYFSIEYSYDGIDWEELDKVYGAGNSTEVIEYSFYDFDCFHNQLVYYRIVQVDFDGTRSSSKVKPLNVVQPYIVKIFPNPTKGNTTVEINAEFGDRTGNVVVRTMSGQKVFSKSIVNGKNQLNLMQLAPDTYIIKVSAPDQLPYYEKLVIMK